MPNLQPLDPIGYRGHSGKFCVTKIAEIRDTAVICEDGTVLDWEMVLPPF